MAYTMVTETPRRATDDHRWHALAERCPPELATLTRARAVHHQILPHRWEEAIRQGAPHAELIAEVAALASRYSNNLDRATTAALKYLPQVAAGTMTVAEARIRVAYTSTRYVTRLHTGPRTLPVDPHYPDWITTEPLPTPELPDPTVAPYLRDAIAATGRNSLITAARADAIEGDAQIAAEHLWQTGQATGRTGDRLLATVRPDLHLNSPQRRRLRPLLTEGRLAPIFVGTEATGHEGALLWWWGNSRLGDPTPPPADVVAWWAAILDEIYQPGGLHGRPGTYTHGCRCPECRTAWSAYKRQRRAA